MKARTVFNLIDGSTVCTDAVECSRKEVEEIIKNNILPSLAKSTYLSLNSGGGIRIVMLHAIVDFYVEEA